MRKILSTVAPLVVFCSLAAGVVSVSRADDSDERERAHRSEIADRDGDRDGDEASERSGHREHRRGERHRHEGRRDHSTRQRGKG